MWPKPVCSTFKKYHNPESLPMHFYWFNLFPSFWTSKLLILHLSARPFLTHRAEHFLLTAQHRFWFGQDPNHYFWPVSPNRPMTLRGKVSFYILQEYYSLKKRLEKILHSAIEEPFVVLKKHNLISRTYFTTFCATESFFRYSRFLRNHSARMFLLWHSLLKKIQISWNALNFLVKSN